MKTRPLPRPSPLRSSTLPWNARAVLPPERKDRNRSSDYQASPAPPDMVTLVDILAEDLGMSKSKARVAVLHGQVSVNEVIVRDPDMFPKSSDVIRFFPPSKIHV